MALQAEHFQTYYDYLPDAVFNGHGHGLIQAIIRKRAENGDGTWQHHQYPIATK
jgi:hypothetical protein